MHPFLEDLYRNIQHTSLIEYVAVVAGIISVWFSRKENIWVYPTGLINTILFIWLSLKASLIGEASVNFYYTVMSVYGWWMWARKDKRNRPVVRITFSNDKEWVQEIIFFLAFYVALFFFITYLKEAESVPFFPNEKKPFHDAIPWADAFASATAYTGMWLMARKKVESWWWWILTNMASIPLYYVKGLALTSIYYLILLVMAVWGLNEWKRRGRAAANAAAVTMERI